MLILEHAGFANHLGYIMKNQNLDLFKSAQTALTQLQHGEVSSVDLVSQCINAIEANDDKINAVVCRDFDRALIQAKLADERRAKEEALPPLLGLPMTVKESFNVVGLPTSWGEPKFKDWYPQEPSLLIERLTQSGAIILGKTNVPTMLSDWQTYNPIFGVTNNPWNEHYSPGGSSGGSAAAIAAGFSYLELGSDFAGSIRVPAAFCGIYAHKPSIHLLPLRGVTPPMTPPTPNPKSDFIVAGPMARSAVDLELSLPILAGPDEQWDGRGYRLALQKPKPKSIKDFRILILCQHPLCDTDTAIQNALEDLSKVLIKEGATVSLPDSPPIPLDEITQTYVKLFMSFVGAHMPIEVYESMQLKASTLEAKDMSIDALVTKYCAASHRQVLEARRKQDELRRQFRTLFIDYDVIFMPTMSRPALKHDHSSPLDRTIDINGQTYPYSSQYSWPSIATLFGLPVTVAPISQTHDNLPIGIQIVADYLSDFTSITMAKWLEQHYTSFTQLLSINED